ncbi:MAG: DUF4070 domain-containing protein, partial [Planctomycetes bacterium]|nr:DUF4070 domain-containing protein [Planctomycetota bacterium]
ALTQFGSHRLVELADDNTFAGTRNFDQLFDLFSRYKLRYFTEADWRIGENPSLLAGLASSGCVHVLVGVESLVYSHSGMGLKNSSVNRVMDAITAIQEHGIAATGCFIVGSDGETKESISNLATFLLESKLADIQLTLLTPFPGTALYRRLKKEGRLLPDRDWSFYTLFDVTFEPDQMSVVELEQSFRDLVKTVFTCDAVNRRSQLRDEIWKKNLKTCS